MRRADRLFQIVQFLRRERAVTAASLARELGVSERTIYRDVHDLVLSGVPIQGEAGVGYALPASFDLPPLMFDREEVQALVLGARMVETWSDERLARAARSALAKVEHVLPAKLAAQTVRNRLYAPGFFVPKESLAAMTTIRAALDEQRVLRLEYRDEAGKASRRDVRPLALSFWGRTWTLTAWCELRRDFRSFRLDRIGATTALARSFVDEPGRTFEDYLARLASEDERRSEAPAEPSDRAARRTEETAQRADRAATPRAPEAPRAGRDASHAAQATRRPSDEIDRADPKARRVGPAAPRAARRARRVEPETARTAAKSPKLDLSAAERRVLGRATLRVAELASLSARELCERTGGALELARCTELVALAAFQRLGSVGLEMARDFVLLGFQRPAELVGRDPHQLFARLCELTHSKQDPCVVDTFRCAIAQAEHSELPAPWREWHRWTPLRDAPAGTLPDELRER